jgi:hypothetical protein
MNNLSNSTAEGAMTPPPPKNEEGIFSPQISESGEFISSQQLKRILSFLDLGI